MNIRPKSKGTGEEDMTPGEAFVEINTLNDELVKLH
jgi:hypothetical protein